MRGLGIPAGVVVALCAVAPAHAQLLGPKAYLDLTPQAVAIGVPPVLHTGLELDVTAVTGGADVMVVRGADGRLHVYIPGVHILSRVPGCTGGQGYAKCRGPVDGLTARLGAGNDRWRAHGDLDAAVYAGAGDDTLTGDSRRSQLLGEHGDDRLLLRGSALDSFALGGPGNDHLEAQVGGHLAGDDGDDVLVGGPERDTLYADGGNDVLIGGDGPDALYGADGHDRLEAGAGDDRLAPGTGTDVVLGGDGRDRLSYVDAPGPLTVTLDGVDDDGGPGENDHLEGIEDVSGGGLSAAPDDRIVGDDLPNSLNNARGAQGLVDGRGGDDQLGNARVLIGGDGDDAIEMPCCSGARAEGGNGADRIRGQELGQSCDRTCVDAFYAYDVTAGSDDDTILLAMADLADAAPDAITCGDGWDAVEADHEDVVALDCEVVERR